MLLVVVVEVEAKGLMRPLLQGVLNVDEPLEAGPAMFGWALDEARVGSADEARVSWLFNELRGVLQGQLSLCLELYCRVLNQHCLRSAGLHKGPPTFASSHSEAPNLI